MCGSGDIAPRILYLSPFDAGDLSASRLFHLTSGYLLNRVLGYPSVDVSEKFKNTLRMLEIEPQFLGHAVWRLVTITD
jgi:hypothetical protein